MLHAIFVLFQAGLVVIAALVAMTPAYFVGAYVCSFFHFSHHGLAFMFVSFITWLICLTVTVKIVGLGS